jgi:hypothetical protein
MSLTRETYNRVRHHYDEHGLPLAWREIENAGVKEAVTRFLGQYPVTQEQIALLADICSYHADSPLWSAPDTDTGLFPDQGHLDLLADLRHDAKVIDTVDALENWLVAAYLLAGLEPLGELPLWLRMKKHVNREGL